MAKEAGYRNARIEERRFGMRRTARKGKGTGRRQRCKAVIWRDAERSG